MALPLGGRSCRWWHVEGNQPKGPVTVGGVQLSNLIYAALTSRQAATPAAPTPAQRLAKEQGSNAPWPETDTQTQAVEGRTYTPSSMLRMRLAMGPAGGECLGIKVQAVNDAPSRDRRADDACAKNHKKKTKAERKEKKEHDEQQFVHATAGGSGLSKWLKRVCTAPSPAPPDAAQKAFNCTLGNLATAEPHGGLLPFQAAQWQLRTAEGWRDDSEVKVLRGPLSFPPVLHLVTEQPSEDAVFELVEEFLNGQPFWRCCETGKESWLYSTADGFWCLSKEEYQLLSSRCSLGTIASVQPHGGAMPHLCDAWQVRSDSGWSSSRALLQTNPSVLHVEEIFGRCQTVKGFKTVLSEAHTCQNRLEQSGAFGIAGVKTLHAIAAVVEHMRQGVLSHVDGQAARRIQTQWRHHRRVREHRRRQAEREAEAQANKPALREEMKKLAEQRNQEQGKGTGPTAISSPEPEMRAANVSSRFFGELETLDMIPTKASASAPSESSALQKERETLRARMKALAEERQAEQAKWQCRIKTAIKQLRQWVGPGPSDATLEGLLCRFDGDVNRAATAFWNE